jgi:hypothetical protein
MRRQMQQCSSVLQTLFMNELNKDGRVGSSEEVVAKGRGQVSKTGRRQWDIRQSQTDPLVCSVYSGVLRCHFIVGFGYTLRYNDDCR